MVVREEKNNRVIFKSDDNKYIRKVGTEQLFVTAIDLIDKGYEYEETDIEIPQPPKEMNNDEYNSRETGETGNV